jgi:hypothetical protein
MYIHTHTHELHAIENKQATKNKQYEVMAGLAEPASIDQELLIVFRCQGLLLEYNARNHHPLKHHI